MIGRKIELHHNTPEQVETFIRDALGMLDRINPPDGLREAVFVQAVQMLQARAIQWEQVGPMMAIPGGKL